MHINRLNDYSFVLCVCTNFRVFVASYYRSYQNSYYYHNSWTTKELLLKLKPLDHCSKSRQVSFFVLFVLLFYTSFIFKRVQPFLDFMYWIVFRTSELPLWRINLALIISLHMWRGSKGRDFTTLRGLNFADFVDLVMFREIKFPWK